MSCWILAGILTLLKTVEEIQERLQARKERRAFNRKPEIRAFKRKPETQAFNRKPVGQRI
jgi:hypothetical protein